MKIMIPGGHLTPALALCDYILTSHPEVEIFFVGRRYSQDSLKQKSHEEMELKKRNIPFFVLQAARLSKGNILEKIKSIPEFFASLYASYKIVKKNKPDVLVSFGGYIALPLALVAWVLGVPIITHEQTRAAGVTNRFIARFAAKVAISYPETKDSFPSKKTVLTGNPLRSDLFNTKPIKPVWANLNLNKPLLYITGGNQGSEIINTIVSQVLPQLTHDWSILHQCGNPTSVRNYRLELEKAASSLPSTQKNRYCVREWVSTEDLNWVYSHCHGVVSRAGANTVSELAVLGLPSILIPLPFSHHNEQQANAEWLAKRKASLLLPQRELSPQTLLKAVSQLAKKHTEMKKALEMIDLPTNADQQLFSLIQAVVKK